MSSYNNQLQKKKLWCQIAKGKKAVDREKGCQTAKTKLKKNKACAHHWVGSRCSLRVGCCRRSRRCSSLPWVVAAGCVLCAVGRAWVWGVAAGCGGRGWVPGLWFLLEFGERLRSDSTLRGRGGLCFWLSYRVGLGRVSPTPTAGKNCYFCHVAISAMTAMAPPFESCHATAIRWRFFKKPPCFFAMAAIWQHWSQFNKLS